ncbi:unnamed protein product [Candidula unifasciata]|uniref:Peptidase metallopeptidase domain-containing protein n=1 Tax=Candidula unifasciata TaxID=100452 RepID=A0A8S3YM35_9EUPU|nr:unnamed protein product [Candidula unifasciata]
MLWWRTLLVGLVHALLLVLVVVGEPFYQRRDHLDQAKYLKTTNENVVKDRTDAEFVLSKYGYLRCQVSRRKREAASRYLPPQASDLLPGMGMGLEEGGEICDEKEVQKAIRNYQRTYNLPETGELDDETKSLMSTSRCGNKDREKDQIKAKEKDQNLVDISINKNDSAQQKHASSVLTEDGEDNKSSLAKTHRLWKRSAPPSRSKLYEVLAGKKPTTRTQAYHRRYLSDFKKKIHSETTVKRTVFHTYQTERRKRSVHVLTSNNQHLEHFDGDKGVLFNKEVIRWRLLTTGFSTRIPVEDQRATIDLAFRMWSEVIPLRFIEDTSSDINAVDIEIAFGKGSHQNCEHDFDGSGGDIAHSWNAGNMHFDDEENFKSIQSYNNDGIYLLRVAVHEIGHVLGLNHTNKTYSIMYAYHATELTPEFELSWDDRHDIQNIYGVCKGSFNTAFDWVRRRPDNQFIYNTYFFRGNHYWMYENHANRTRYGDPLYVAREWDGVPDNVDGYVHIWLFNGGEIIDDAYFFKGEHYYKYDSEKDRVVEGWPKLIKDGFGPKPGETEGIPDNIDSVFFDTRDKNVYFFKNDYVYVYNPAAPESDRGCCVRKRKIIEEYPPAEGHRPLPSNLDVVYYSYKDKTMYFFKGDNLWRNKLFDPRQRRIHNSIEFLGPWYQKWMDICDVVAMN